MLLIVLLKIALFRILEFRDHSSVHYKTTCFLKSYATLSSLSDNGFGFQARQFTGFGKSCVDLGHLNKY